MGVASHVTKKVYHTQERGRENCFTALGWSPEGRTAKGGPKTNWRRTVEIERSKTEWKS